MEKEKFTRDGGSEGEKEGGYEPMEMSVSRSWKMQRNRLSPRESINEAFMLTPSF